MATFGDWRDRTPIEVDSIPKCERRNLYVADDLGIYVAQIEHDGQVQETEILLTGHRPDGMLDFVVYGPDGVLTDRSPFPTLGNGPTVVATAPFTCMTCHVDYSGSVPTYDLLVPETGACAP